jgi:RNA polymerase sigma factor (sigma-70 family)
MDRSILPPPRSGDVDEAAPFDDLVRRVRAGDQDAASELVKRYESSIRRAVRLRLADARLGNVLDSMDICQSVLASFFVRAASGQYELKTPDQLMKLLTAMARNKLISQARRQRALRREGRRVASGFSDDGRFVARGASPSGEMAARDLLQQIHQRLSAEERGLLELRNQGHDWSAIAEKLGGNADALRKKLGRALDRVATQLGVDDQP